MTTFTDDDLVRLLRDAVPPPEVHHAPSALWPRVLGGLAVARRPPTAPEWALVAIVIALCVLRPSTLRVLLFHF